MNLIKNSFSSNHGTRRNLISTTVGLGLGYLAYRMVAGKSPGMVKKTTARALQVGVTSFLAKKLGLWGKFAQNLLAKRRNRADAFVN